MKRTSVIALILACLVCPALPAFAAKPKVKSSVKTAAKAVPTPSPTVVPEAVRIALKTAAPSEAVFTSFTGKVTLKAAAGRKAREIHLGSKARQGAIVTSDKDSRATIQFFDGSTLELKPQTQLILNTIKKAKGSRQKNLHFTLNFGSLLAKVSKLLTAKSSFEIESGGVVCGVRGTEFLITAAETPGAGGGTNKSMNVQVFEGSVLVTDMNGQEFILNAGDSMQFLNGISSIQPKAAAGPVNTGGTTGNNGDPALGDLTSNFTADLYQNQGNNLTDPAVGGSVQLNVHVNVSPIEAAP